MTWVCSKKTECYVEEFLAALQASDFQEKVHIALPEDTEQLKKDLKLSQAREERWRHTAATLQTSHTSLEACYGNLMQDYGQLLWLCEAFRVEVTMSKAAEASSRRDLHARCVDTCTAQTQRAFAAYSAALDHAALALQAEEKAHHTTSLSVQDLLRELHLAKTGKDAAAAAAAGAIKEAQRWKALHKAAASLSIAESPMDELAWEALNVLDDGAASTCTPSPESSDFEDAAAGSEELAGINGRNLMAHQKAPALLELMSEPFSASRSCAVGDDEPPETPQAKRPSSRFDISELKTPEKLALGSKLRRSLGALEEPQSAKKAALAFEAEKEVNNVTWMSSHGPVQELGVASKEQAASDEAVAIAVNHAPSPFPLESASCQDTCKHLRTGSELQQEIAAVLRENRALKATAFGARYNHLALAFRCWHGATCTYKQLQMIETRLIKIRDQQAAERSCHTAARSHWGATMSRDGSAKERSAETPPDDIHITFFGRHS